MSGYQIKHNGVLLPDLYHPSIQGISDLLNQYWRDNVKDIALDLLTIVEIKAWQSFPNHPDYDYWYRVSQGETKKERQAVAEFLAMKKLIRDTEIVGV